MSSPAVRTFERASCPCCGAPVGTATPTDWAPAPWRLVRCGDCSLVYLANPPTFEALGDEVAWEKTYAAEAGRRASLGLAYRAGAGTARRLRGAVNRLLRRDKLRAWLEQEFPGEVVLVEPGCSFGFNARSFPPGVRPHGIEVSPPLAAEADAAFRALGGGASCAPAIDGLQALAPGSVDVGLLKSYLEHEVDPGGVLDAFARVLRPGGGLIIKVPNLACWNRAFRGRRWCGFRHPDHVNYFTPGTLGRLLGRHGFAVARMGWRDRFPLSDNLWCLARLDP